jgi:hypothetical protein
MRKYHLPRPTDSRSQGRDRMEPPPNPVLMGQARELRTEEPRQEPRESTMPPLRVPLERIMGEHMVLLTPSCPKDWSEPTPR